ncbi:PD-(D/E)XK nuclease superfamily protein [Planctomycetes bacterium MalM25]|nr:PD-(D/E)XK nuclease superfamily protein [Planctomycetes bacterium MalM25]
MGYRPHTSYSAISQYQRCPLQYYFQRILKLPSDTVASGLVLGGAVHEALAEYHLQLQRIERASVPDLNVEEVRWKLIEEFERRENEAKVVYGSRETRDGLIEQGMTLVETYLKLEPPKHIRQVEQTVLVPLVNSSGDPLETPLATVADLIYGEDDGLTIRELKTSKRAYTQDQIDTALQATCYANAVVESRGVWPRIEYAVLTKTKTPRAQLLTTSRGVDDVGRLGDLVQTIQRAIAAKVFYPIESPLNCSGCPYRAECLEWKPATPTEWELIQLGDYREPTSEPLPERLPEAAPC